MALSFSRPESISLCRRPSIDSRFSHYCGQTVTIPPLRFLRLPPYSPNPTPHPRPPSSSTLPLLPMTKKSALAIQEAKRRKIPVFDFNLSVSLKATPTLDAKTVIGPAEITLPMLVRMAGAPTPLPLAATAATSEEDASPLGRRSREERSESGSGNGDASEQCGTAKVRLSRGNGGTSQMDRWVGQ